MCFSAQASFIAGFGLLSSGLYFFNKRPFEHRYRLIKLIPVFFGIQQLCEGVVWLTQTNPAHQLLANVFKYCFLFYAFILWPTYVPFALIQATKGWYRDVQLFLMGLGVSVSSMLAYWSFVYGVSCRISCHHVEYFFNQDQNVITPVTVFYLLATVVAFFFTDNKKLQQAGLLIGVSAAISAYFYTVWFTSVWCFFAAVISSFIFFL